GDRCALGFTVLDPGVGAFIRYRENDLAFLLDPIEGVALSRGAAVAVGVIAAAAARRLPATTGSHEPEGEHCRPGETCFTSHSHSSSSLSRFTKIDAVLVTFADGHEPPYTQLKALVQAD